MGDVAPGSSGSGSLEAALARRIAEGGPIPVADYMTAANAHYYATRDPLGAGGDFTTAPEISQMFGELVGAWAADLAARAAPAATPRYVELGPGRGTLTADALRVMGKAGLRPPVEMVETSPTLRAAQAKAVPHARWHDAVDTLPTDAPLIVVANEFFDALPIEQCIRTPEGWHDRLVDMRADGFIPVLGRRNVESSVPLPLRAAPVGSLFEASPASHAIIRDLAARIASQGGAMLVVDYGHVQSAIGETLQAVKDHAPTSVWSSPGEHDLTAHVDFEALGRAAARAGLRVHGPLSQGDWLRSLGLDLRAAALAKADPARAAEVEAARYRLADPAQMGELFKVAAFVAPGWPEPAGFA